jgi:hypothetical protein
MDCRVKPGNDDVESRSRDAMRARVLPTKATNSFASEK